VNAQLVKVDCVVVVDAVGDAEKVAAAAGRAAAAWAVEVAEAACWGAAWVVVVEVHTALVGMEVVAMDWVPEELVGLAGGAREMGAAWVAAMAEVGAAEMGAADGVVGWALDSEVEVDTVDSAVATMAAKLGRYLVGRVACFAHGVLKVAGGHYMIQQQDAMATPNVRPPSCG